MSSWDGVWAKEAQMRGGARILVIGPTALGSAVAHALPRCQSVATDALLSGLWTAGQQDFEGVVVSLAAGRAALRAIHSILWKSLPG